MSHDHLNRHSEDEDLWYAELRNVLESTYLTIDDPREQSRFSGDRARWEPRSSLARARSIIATEASTPVTRAPDLANFRAT